MEAGLAQWKVWFWAKNIMKILDFMVSDPPKIIEGSKQVWPFNVLPMKLLKDYTAMEHEAARTIVSTQLGHWQFHGLNI